MIFKNTLTLIFFLVSQNVIAQDFWDGKSYQATMRSQSEDGQNLIDLMDEDEKKDLHIIDIGCGSGANTAKLLSRFPFAKITGIDASKSMIDFAKEVYGQNIDFINQKAEELSQINTFDCAFSVHVLHWLDDIRLSLKNIYNALKSNGQGYFLFTAGKKGLPYQAALEKTIHDSFEKDFQSYQSNLHIYSFDEMESLMKDAGFKIELAFKKLNRRIYDNSTLLKDWIAQWCPHKKFLSSENHDRFMDLLIKNYLEEINVAEKDVPWDEYVLVFWVRKI